MANLGGPSTSIGTWRMAAWVDDLHRMRRRAAIARGLVAGTFALTLGALSVGAHDIAALTREARCHRAREAAGLSVTRLRRAFAEGGAGFHTVSVPASEGHRLRLIVSKGPWAGDAWEADPYGIARPVADSCTDAHPRLAL